MGLLVVYKVNRVPGLPFWVGSHFSNNNLLSNLEIHFNGYLYEDRQHNLHLPRLPWHPNGRISAAEVQAHGCWIFQNMEDPGRRKTGSHSYRNQTKTLHIFEGQIQNMHCCHLSEMRPNPYVHPILTYQYQDKPKPVTPSRVRKDPTTPG